ncbi:MAG: PGPGW domain-containing protein [Actinomycetota bacterium]
MQAVARFLVRSTRRAALTLVGFLLVCVGLAGLLLPVLPGWILIIGGFAVLSREYSWANSCLAFCRRHAAKSGTKLRKLASRRRTGPARDPGEVVLDPSGEVVIDLTRVQRDPVEESEDSSTGPRSSQAGAF